MAVALDRQTDLLSRAGDLKAELVAFAEGPRCAKDLRRALKERSTESPIDDDEEFIAFLDWFVLDYHGSDGRTILERFVAARSDLSDVERELLFGWRDVVEGVFEIVRRDGPAVVTVSLLDDLAYRMRTNTDPSLLRPMKKGRFLVTRAVPVAREWMLSGVQRVVERSERRTMLELAATWAARRPDLVFRNPAKVAQGWELQRRDRKWFVEWWGDDLVVFDGAEFAKRFGEYWRWRVRQSTAGELPRQPLPAALEVTFPEDVVDANTVAVLYDEAEGMRFLPEFGIVEETFADPRLLADRDHRSTVHAYLDDDTISPAPIRRLAERDVSKASALFERLLKKPGFSWPRDGDRLLRNRKAAHFARPARPLLVPISHSASPLHR